MKRYRKMVAVVAAAAVLCSMGLALAGDTQQHVNVTQLYEQAAEGWHAAYEAYGRTVTVDIPVQVPQTDTFPALEAVLMPSSDYAPYNDGYSMVTEGNESFANSAGVFRWDTPSEETVREAKSQQYEEHKSTNRTTKEKFIRLNEIDWDTAYVYQNDGTVREANGKMMEMAERFFPEEDAAFTPHWVHGYDGMYQVDAKTGTLSGDPWPDVYGVLMVYFDQVIGGIPLLDTAAGAFYNFTGDTRGKEKNFVGGVGIIEKLDTVDAADTYYSMQAQMLKTTGTLAEDLPLCSFAKVLDTYEALIAAGKLRSVDSLRLGYIAWQGKDDGFTLLPVWVAEGELFQSAEADYSAGKPTELSSVPLEYGDVMVNAQTGEWIDPWNGEENQTAYVPAILTWDSVGE